MTKVTIFDRSGDILDRSLVASQNIALTNSSLITNSETLGAVNNNTNIIADALARTKDEVVISVPNGETVYVIRIVIPDGKTVRIVSGIIQGFSHNVITSGLGSSSCIFTTSGVFQPWRNITALTASNNVCTATCELADLPAVGSYVSVMFTAQEEYPGVWQVLSATPNGASSTFTFKINHTPSVTTATVVSSLNIPDTASGNGKAVTSICFKPAQRYAGLIVESNAELKHCGLNTIFDSGATGGIGLMGVALGHCAKLYIDIKGKVWNSPKYGVHVFAVNELWVEHVDTDAISAGFQFHGPIHNGYAKSLRCVDSGDNNFGFGSTDYPDYTQSSGPVWNWDVQNMEVLGTIGAFRLFGHSAYHVNCTVRNVVGFSLGGSLFEIQDDAARPNTTSCWVGRLAVENMDGFNSGSIQSTFKIYGSRVDDVVIEKCATRQGSLSSRVLFDVSGGCKKITIRDCNFEGGTSGVIGTIATGLANDIAINLESVTIASTTGLLSVNAPSSTARTITVNATKCSFTTSNYLFNQGGSDPIIFNCSQSYLNVANQFLGSGQSGPITFNLTDNYYIATGTYLINTGGTPGNLTIKSKGNNWASVGSVNWNGAGSGRLRLYAEDLPFDVTQQNVGSTFAVIDSAVANQYCISTTTGTNKQGRAIKVNASATNTWYALGTGASGVNTLIV